MQTSPGFVIALDTMSDTQIWLERFIEAQDGIAGTVHVIREGALRQTASVNIPEKVLALTETVPKGKGMAGLAWERDQPVQTCNLQTDQSGDVRPGAKAVNALAAIALPVHDENGVIRAVVGIAFGHERELGSEEVERLDASSRELPRDDP